MVYDLGEAFCENFIDWRVQSPFRILLQNTKCNHEKSHGWTVLPISVQFR